MGGMCIFQLLMARIIQYANAVHFTQSTFGNWNPNTWGTAHKMVLKIPVRLNSGWVAHRQIGKLITKSR